MFREAMEPEGTHQAQRVGAAVTWGIDNGNAGKCGLAPTVGDCQRPNLAGDDPRDFAFVSRGEKFERPRCRPSSRSTPLVLLTVPTEEKVTSLPSLVSSDKLMSRGAPLPSARRPPASPARIEPPPPAPRTAPPYTMALRRLSSSVTTEIFSIKIRIGQRVVDILEFGSRWCLVFVFELTLGGVFSLDRRRPSILTGGCRGRLLPRAARGAMPAVRQGPWLVRW